MEVGNGLLCVFVAYSDCYIPMQSIIQSTTDGPICMNTAWNAYIYIYIYTTLVRIQYFHLNLSLGCGHEGPTGSLVEKVL